MTSRFKTAIFDMDGTLLDSMRFWRLMSVEYLTAHGVFVPDDLLAGVFDRPGGAGTTTRRRLPESWRNGCNIATPGTSCPGRM